MTGRVLVAVMSSLRSRDYNDQFDCKKYLKDYHSSEKGSENEEGSAEFRLVHLHRFYEKYSCKWDSTNARLLDFGGGPVISGLISAAPHVQQIIFAAHTEDERKEVQLWKNQTDGAHDWSPFFKYVVGDLESKDGDAAWQERAALLRSRLTITSCDIFQEYPIGIKMEENNPFSIIYTSLCLEAVCDSFSEYKTAVKKLGRLLKPGGYLVMFVVERETFYMVGQHKWFCLSVTLAEVKEALYEAGFELLLIERDPSPMKQIQNPISSDFKASLFVAAYKVLF